MTNVFTRTLNKAVELPSSAIQAHVDSIRRRRPEDSPAQVIKTLEREYLGLVSGSGAAVGAVAAIPVVGSGVALGLTGGGIAAFLASSAAFSLAVASVHGIAVDDVTRRRTLLLATILGEKGAHAVSDAAGISSVQVGRVLLTRMPMSTVRQVNSALTHRFIRSQTAKHAGLALGRVLPYGVGAAIGASGGLSLGRTVIAGARSAFGTPPAVFMHSLDSAPTPPELPPPPRVRGLTHE